MGRQLHELSDDWLDAAADNVRYSRVLAIRSGETDLSAWDADLEEIWLERERRENTAAARH